MRVIISLLISLLALTAPLRANPTEVGFGVECSLRSTILRTDSNTLATPLAPALPAIKPQPHTFWGLRTVQIGTGVIGVGLLTSVADLQTRQLRLDYLPNFRSHYDDYTQFAPAAAAVVMKSLGLESRSSWERLIVSDALSVGTMASVVYIVKYSLGRLRPDGSTHNSFPSGHTAMGFTSATILHKEYGYLSPWVSIAGYTAAVATGVGRVINNRHWLSDIVVGAGVGILSTEFGYWLGDIIFKDRGLIRPNDNEWAPIEIGRKPSFIGVGIGHNITLYDRSRFELVAPSGVGFNIEGAWFWNEHLGVGGEFSVGRHAELIDKRIAKNSITKTPSPLNSLALKVGLYYNINLTERWHLGAKTLAGFSKNHYLKTTLTDATGNTTATLHYNTSPRITATTGLSLRYVAANNLGVRLFTDYNWLRTDYTLTPSTGNAIYQSSYRHPLTVGIAIDAMLW